MKLDLVVEWDEQDDVERLSCYSTSSSKKTLRIWAIFLFGKCGVLHI